MSSVASSRYRCCMAGLALALRKASYSRWTATRLRESPRAQPGKAMYTARKGISLLGERAARQAGAVSCGDGDAKRCGVARLEFDRKLHRTTAKDHVHARAYDVCHRGPVPLYGTCKTLQCRLPRRRKRSPTKSRHMCRCPRDAYVNFPGSRFGALDEIRDGSIRLLTLP